MAIRRSNKARNQCKGKRDAPWFYRNKRRARKRAKIAKESRRRNRKSG